VVIRFEDSSGELISHTRVKQGGGYRGSGSGQDDQNVALLAGIPPHGYDAP